ncbi:MAG: hypothetical protein HY318_05875 [Armatimonadetes bacterium]|nr:hypothetical protein [Armatimonadota bacterium]
MSTRRMADKAEIERFLHELGHRFHRAGRVYLVGGTTLVLEGLRTESLDIDIVWRVDPQHDSEFVRVVRELIGDLCLNVEEASPEHFIPLPAGHFDRCQFVGRYGNLDVFHFDVYSTALSKIARGTDEDLSDVLQLLGKGYLVWEKLEDLFNEILPEYATKSLKRNPEVFQSHFSILRQLWEQR